MTASWLAVAVAGTVGFVLLVVACTIRQGDFDCCPHPDFDNDPEEDAS